MPTKMEKTVHAPIIEAWRVVALVLVVAAAMLFVRVIDPAAADQTAPPQGHPAAR